MTLFKAGVREVVPQILPIPEGAFYANGLNPQDVVHAQYEAIKDFDYLADVYEQINKFYNVRTTASC